MGYAGEQYLSYRANEHGEWELAPCFCPDSKTLRTETIMKKLPPIASLPYKERDKVTMMAGGIVRECVIDNLHASYIFSDKLNPNKIWVIYYDIRWHGTGHTHGYITAEELNRYNRSSHE